MGKEILTFGILKLKKINFTAIRFVASQKMKILRKY